MNLKRRYCCVAIAIAVVCVLIIATWRRRSDFENSDRGVYDDPKFRRRYVESPEWTTSDGTRRRHAQPPRSGDGRYCRMSTCFDLSRCRRGFTVHVHPNEGATSSTSFKYSEILRALRASRYYTDDPERACVFVLSMTRFQFIGFTSFNIFGL